MKPVHKQILLAFVMAIIFATTTRASPKGQVILGPDNSGPARNGAQWLTGANGAGSTSIDFDDHGRGGFDFVLSNSVAGKENNADWRCPPFPTGVATDGKRPMTFSFAYKLPDSVAKGNNIHVQLRFFDASGTNFISEYVFPVGARTGDSSMTDYKTVTIENIHASARARTADVWIDANIFEPWVSGTARFADISLTVAPRSLLFKAGVITAILAAVAVSISFSVFFWRRRASTL